MIFRLTALVNHHLAEIVPSAEDFLDARIRVHICKMKFSVRKRARFGHRNEFELRAKTEILRVEELGVTSTVSQNRLVNPFVTKNPLFEVFFGVPRCETTKETKG